MTRQLLSVAIALALLSGCEKTNAATGKELYDRNPCSACHNIGAGGAPIPGVKSAWAARIKKGPEALTRSVVRGMGAMPPRGATALTDAELRAIVEYMMERGR
jgi:cytochrome c5